MRLTWLRGTCNDSKICPTVHGTDRGTYVVQGWIVTDPDALAQLNLPEGETAVEVPASLLPEVSAQC